MAEKMSAAIQEKQKVVNEIKAKIENAKSVIIISYDKITVEEDTSLRREFRKNNIDYKVYKNTLIKRAFYDLGVKDFDAALNGTTSLAFGNEDVNTAARITAEQAKKLGGEKLKVKCGYLDKAFADEKYVLALASIPTKEVLLSKLLGSLKGNLFKLAQLVQAISEKQANA